jgi:hypothetical protein
MQGGLHEGLFLLSAGRNLSGNSGDLALASSTAPQSRQCAASAVRPMLERKGIWIMKHARVAAALAALALSGAAQAALFDLGDGMIYEDDRGLTWLADWNLAKTTGFSVDGLMDWDTAKAWADNLVFGGFSDWRLPNALNLDGSGPDEGYNHTGNEMQHMFYVEIGAKATQSILTGDPAKLALFKNMQLEQYWSNTEYQRWPGQGYAGNFNTIDGWQGYQPKGYMSYAVAVRGVDVVAIPEPENYLMMLAGLCAIVSVVCRSRAAASHRC